MKTKIIRQATTFHCSPHDVYEALMDSEKHSHFTGSKAVIHREVGASFSAYDGDIFGKNVELVPDKKIVQEWFCEADGWPKAHFSRATFVFSKIKEGTRLDFMQTDVPETAYEDIAKGWQEYYWKPMKEMLEK